MLLYYIVPHFCRCVCLRTDAVQCLQTNVENPLAFRFWKRLQITGNIMVSRCILVGFIPAQWPIVFVLVVHESLLLKTTDRCTAAHTTIFIFFRSPLALSWIQDFFRETKEQVLHGEFTKRKNICNCFLRAGPIRRCFSHTRSHSIPFFFFLHTYKIHAHAIVRTPNV